MIKVTTPAKDILKDILLDATQGAGVTHEPVGLRLALTTDDGQVQLDLVVDQPKDGDVIIEHHGKYVLLVSEPVSARLKGATIDTAEIPGGTQLILLGKA